MIPGDEFDLTRAKQIFADWLSQAIADDSELQDMANRAMAEDSKLLWPTAAWGEPFVWACRWPGSSFAKRNFVG